MKSLHIMCVCPSQTRFIWFILLPFFWCTWPAASKRITAIDGRASLGHHFSVALGLGLKRPIFCVCAFHHGMLYFIWTASFEAIQIWKATKMLSLCIIMINHMCDMKEYRIVRNKRPGTWNFQKGGGLKILNIYQINFKNCKHINQFKEKMHQYLQNQTWFLVCNLK